MERNLPSSWLCLFWLLVPFFISAKKKMLIPSARKRTQTQLARRSLMTHQSRPAWKVRKCSALDLVSLTNSSPEHLLLRSNGWHATQTEQFHLSKSASITPTVNPCLASPPAIFAVIVDLPTPPLPEATAITYFTSGSTFLLTPFNSTFIAET